jgi:eukaryotic-like serine/threonine-protein kinase
MTSALTHTRRRYGTAWRVALRGAINESSDIEEAMSRLDGCVVFDLDGLHKITSFGVKKWRDAIALLEVDYLCFIRARPSIVSQFNMIADFNGTGELLSLYLPYTCLLCGRETQILLDLRRDYAAVMSGELPPVKCACGGETEFDGILDTYLSHVREAPRPSPPPVASPAIDGDEKTHPFRVEMDVEGMVTALWMSGNLDKAGHLRRLGDGLQGEIVFVLSELNGVEPDGLVGLKTLSEACDGEPSLARVPGALAAAIVRACPRAKLTSVLLSFMCRRCGQKTTSEAMEMTLGPMLSGGYGRCPSCDAHLVSDLSIEEREVLRRLPMSELSPNVRSYLKARSGRPKSRPGSVGSRGAAPAAKADRFGDYEILKRLGEGGMGEVFLARKHGPKGFEKKVVLKRILPHLSADAPRFEMFLGEAKIAAQLNHPNVVQIFDLGRIGEEYFIAMEHVAGWDLAKIAKRCASIGAQWPIDLACWIGVEICSALQAAHDHRDESGAARPIVHRDVSPENVFVSRDGAVKLGDFGLAKVVGRPSYTPSSSIRGKAGYMPPERFSGTRSADAREDIFAAGVIVHECIAGSKLFMRDHQAQTLMAIIQHDAPLLASLRADVPAGLDRTLARAIAKEPSERYGSAAEFRQELDRILSVLGRTASPQRLSAWLADLFRGAPQSEADGE